MEFEFIESRDGGHYRADYRGLIIKAVRDDSPENPLEIWDCEPPTLVACERHVFTYAANEPLNLADPLCDVSDAWINRHWRKLADAIRLPHDDFDRAASDRKADCGYSIADARREVISDALEAVKPSRWGGNARDYFKALESLWNARGIVAVAWQSTGYSQGDYAYGLSVATPTWAANVGASKASLKRQCEYAGKLYGFWAWGDVYGYEVETADGEHVDSCWGFYGTDFEESGLADAAREAADCVLHDARRRRTEQAKALLRNRVPLHLRPDMLADAGRIQA